MKSILHRFGRNDGGNFGIMTGLAALPLLLAVGMATDYATMTRVKTELQQATDAAVLAIAREGTRLSQADSEKIAAQFLTATLGETYSNMKVTRDDGHITVDATMDPGLYFSGLFGYKDDDVKAASAADITTASYEIGLVLDTTGSMAGGKLAAMKDAVSGLVDTMSVQVTEGGKLRFALVPFATFVNVGPEFGPNFDKKGKQIAGSGATWLDLAGASQVPQVELTAGASRFQVYENMDQTWAGCVETRYSPGKNYDIDDTAPSVANPQSLFVPAIAIDEPDSGFRNSYIESDAKPNDHAPGQKKKRWKKYGVETDTAGNPLLGGLIQLVLGVLGGRPVVEIDTSMSGGAPKGPTRGCDMQPILPLTTNLAQVKAEVDALKASGNTNIMEGVAWGNRVLSPGEPFTQGSPASRRGVRRIMIVLTDGANTFGNANNALGSTYSSNGYLVDGRLGISSGSSSDTNEAMNERTLAACELAKQSGLEVYTIRLEEPDVATGTMLQRCASDAEHFFDVPDRAKLDEAFQGIKDKVVVVRLAS